MILRILKVVFFVVVILLLGQIRIANHTVAGHLQAGLAQGLTSGGEKLLQWPAIAGIPGVKAATHWLRSGAAKRPSRPAIDKEQSESEEFSSADRESIMRLLPN